MPKDDLTQEDIAKLDSIFGGVAQKKQSKPGDLSDDDIQILDSIFKNVQPKATETQQNVPVSAPQQPMNPLQAVGQTFAAGASEMGKGFLDANANFTNMLDQTAQKINQSPMGQGFNQMIGANPSAEPQGNRLFGAPTQAMQGASQALPNIPAPPLVKPVSHLVGELIGTIPEAMMAQGAANKLLTTGATKATQATRVMSEVTAAALDSFAREYAENGFSGSLPVKALNGAAMSFGLNLVNPGLQVYRNYGGKIARAWIQAVTGDKRLAKNFVENVENINLSMKGVKSSKELSELQALQLDDIKEKNRLVMNDRIYKNDEVRKNLDIELAQKRYAMTEAGRESRMNLQNKSTESLIDETKKLAGRFEENDRIIKEKLQNHFDGSIGKLEDLRTADGELVTQAIDDLISADPTASVKGPFMEKRFKTLLNDNGYSLKGGVVTPKAQSTEEPEITKRLQTLFDELYFNSKTNGGNVPLPLLQELKSGFQRIGSGPRTPLTNISKQLGGILNPAKMEKAAVNVSPTGRQALDRLAEVNARYSNLIPKYEEALDQFTVKNADGTRTANFAPAVTAIMKNDRTKIAQMMKADSALPEEYKMLPQVREVVNAVKELKVGQEKDLLKAKSNFRAQRRKLDTQIREKTQAFNKAAKEDRFATSQKLKRELDEMRINQKSKLTETEAILDAELTRIRDVENLNQFIGKMTNIQTAGTLGMMGTATSAMYGANPQQLMATGAMSGAATLGLSPKVASRAVQGVNKTKDIMENPQTYFLRNLLTIHANKKDKK